MISLGNVDSLIVRLPSVSSVTNLLLNVLKVVIGNFVDNPVEELVTVSLNVVTADCLANLSVRVCSVELPHFCIFKLPVSLSIDNLVMSSVAHV